MKILATLRITTCVKRFSANYYKTNNIFHIESLGEEALLSEGCASIFPAQVIQTVIRILTL